MNSELFKLAASYAVFVFLAVERIELLTCLSESLVAAGASKIGPRAFAFKREMEEIIEPLQKMAIDLSEGDSIYVISKRGDGISYLIVPTKNAGGITPSK